MDRELNYEYGEYVIRWIETFCVHTIGKFGGQPLLLEEWQKEFIRELFAMWWDEEGQRWVFAYQTIVLMVPRGAGKSTLAAALALFKLSPASGEEAPRVLIAAATRDNARHVYDTARDMVGMSAGLREDLGANKNRIWCDSNRGELWRLSGDGSGQFGHVPSFVVRDELHQWETDKQILLSEALQTALAKRDNSQSLTVTTAGYDMEGILGLLYTAAMKSPLLEHPRPGLKVVRDVKAKFLFWCFEAPADAPHDDPATWHMAQPATWIDEDAIAAQLSDPSISVDEFRRQWLNQWTASKEAWLPIGMWRTLARPDAFEEAAFVGDTTRLWIPEGKRVYVAVDAAITRDTTAVSWSWAKSKTEVYVQSMVWSANPDTAHHIFVPGGRIDLALVRDFVAHFLTDRYNVKEVSYDPRFFEGAASELSGMGFKVVPFQQNSPQMADALNEFYIGAHEETLFHDGDEVMTQHVEGTAGVQTERGWKVFKLKQTKKIDACISGVMSTARARLALKRQRSFIYVSDKKEEEDVQQDPAPEA